MPIAENFPEGLTPTGKINLDDGNFHIMWGPGKKTNTDGSQAEVFADSDVVAAYAARNEEQVPLGVSGTYVAVDWDSCTAQGSCFSVCPVQTFQWYRTEKDIAAADCKGETFEGTGLTEADERLDYSDKSQPIREHDCTICMACQEICPEGAILIESANQEWHEKAAGTYVVMPSSGGGPHAHD